MEKVAPNSNLLGILLKIIRQSKNKGTLDELADFQFTQSYTKLAKMYYIAYQPWKKDTHAYRISTMKEGLI